MTPIVVQLQHDSLDRNIPVADLLRKSLVAARKLKIAEFESWIRLELEGYTDDATIPPYRELRGEVKVLNPYRGWMPLSFATTRQAEALSTRMCGQPIAELQSLLDGQPNDTTLSLRFPPAIEKELMGSMQPMPLQPVFHLSQGALHGLLDAVRTTVLNWALKLEEDGILGENFTFSDAERSKASSGYHVNNFYGAVSHSQFAPDADRPLQVTISASININEIKELLVKVKTAAAGLNLPAEQRAELSAEFATIESQIASPRPKSTIIKASLASIKSILEGAAGGALGELLLELAKVLM